MLQVRIHSIAFDDDGDVHITYIADGDMKVNGLGQSHTILVPAAATEYTQGIEDLNIAARDLLLDAIDDLHRLETIPMDRPAADIQRLSPPQELPEPEEE